jgi:hypothetical protein
MYMMSHILENNKFKLNFISNGKLEWKRSWPILRYYTKIFPEGLSKTTQTPVKVASLPIKTRTQDVPNTKQECQPLFRFPFCRDNTIFQQTTSNDVTYLISNPKLIRRILNSLVKEGEEYNYWKNSAGF